MNVLYSSPEGKMEWYETMVPFSESIEGGMTGTQPICWVHCQTKEYEVEPAEDYDGEMRALSLNLSMDVEMKLWEERNGGTSGRCLFAGNKSCATERNGLCKKTAD